MTSVGHARDKVGIELYISKKFNSIFDLGYALVDLQALITSINYVTYTQHRYKSLPITSRTFAVKYKSELLMVDFKQGSFWSNLISTVLGGLIVMFAEKYIDYSTDTVPPVQPVTINMTIQNNINNIIHNEIHNGVRNTKMFVIHCEDQKLKQQMAEIVERTSIIPNDSVQSTENLITEINSSEILGAHKIPVDEQGIKSIAISVDRFAKSVED